MTAEIRETDVLMLDRLQDVLRSSVDGLCEHMLPALGFAHRDSMVRALREDRGLDIESAVCIGFHAHGTGTHRRFRWHWRPRARQLETGIAR